MTFNKCYFFNPTIEISVLRYYDLISRGTIYMIHTYQLEKKHLFTLICQEQNIFKKINRKAASMFDDYCTIVVEERTNVCVKKRKGKRKGGGGGRGKGGGGGGGGGGKEDASGSRSCDG